MYEHLRNAFLMELQPHFDSKTLDRIMGKLDKVAADYEINERETALAVLDNGVPQVVRLYLASKKLEGLSDLTIKMYLNRLRIFFDAVCKEPQNVEANDIRLFLATYQMQNNISDRTLDKIRQILNCFFQWCLNEEYICKNPCRNIKEIKYEVQPRHSLSRFQLERLRRNCKSKRDLAIVDVLYSTGCRVRELVNMRFCDINETDNSVEIIGKGKKHNTVYLNTNAQISLKEYLEERKGDSEYIFVTERKPHRQMSIRAVQHIFREHGKELNFILSPHILRHTSATLALQNGMSITQVQKMLGHSSVNTTQIYVETSQDDVSTAHKKYVI